VYAAWVAEADQRAAAGLALRLPSRPRPALEGMERVLATPRTPYERIAVDLRVRILDGTYPAGEPLPTGDQLAMMYRVAKGTAQRAVTVLGTWGLIKVSRGCRAIVVVTPQDVSDQATASDSTVIPTETDETQWAEPPSPGTVTGIPPGDDRVPMGRQLLDLEVRRDNFVVSKVTADADPKNWEELRQLLVDSVQRDGREEYDIARYEMDVREHGDPKVLTTFVTSARG